MDRDQEEVMRYRVDLTSELKKEKKSCHYCHV